MQHKEKQWKGQRNTLERAVERQRAGALCKLSPGGLGGVEALLRRGQRERVVRLPRGQRQAEAGRGRQAGGHSQGSAGGQAGRQADKKAGSNCNRECTCHRSRTADEKFVLMVS